jgi:O-antigen ligase
MFGDNFLLGVGASNFKGALDRYLGPDDPWIEHVAHNTFLEVGAELGVFGLLLLVAIVVLTFRTLTRVRRATAHGRDPLLHLTARGLEASLAGACVSMLFISALHSRLFWFLIIVTMCLPAIPAPARRRFGRAAPSVPASRT